MDHSFLQFAIPLLAMVDKTSEAFLQGQQFGRWGTLAFVIFGLVRCLLSLREPTTNKICVSALITILSVMLLGQATTALTSSSQVPGWVGYLASLVMIGLAGIALLLALIGLAMWKKDQLKGKGHAIWAMVLSILIISAVGISAGIEFSKGVKDGYRQARSDRALQPPGALEAIFAKNNFQLTIPDKWVVMDSKKVQPEACLVYRDVPHDTYLAVIAEQEASLSDGATGILAEVVKTNLSSKLTVLEQNEETVKLGADEFLHLTSRVENPKLSKGIFIFDQWVLARNGYAWQINVWGPVTYETEVHAKSRLIAESFKIRDRQKRVNSSPALSDAERPEYGYSLKLSALGWSRWEHGASTNLPEMADFGATSGGSCVLVMPYKTVAGDPPALEALTRAYLSNIGFEYKRSDTDFATRPLEAPFPGLEVVTEREVDGKRFKYVFHVYQSGSMAWLAGGWYLASDKNGMARLRQALDQVQLYQPSGEVKWQRNDRSAVLAQEQTDFRNELGLWYYEKKDWVKAETHFRAAAQANPRNLTYLINASRAIERQDRAADALEYLEKEPAAGILGGHQEYQIRESWLRLKSGAADVALEEVLALIRNGYQDNDEILDHINEFLDQDKVPEAKRLADAYAAAKPEPRPRLWRAQVTKRTGDGDGALKQMEALTKDEPDYMEGRYSYGEMANNLGKHEIALEVADTLAKEGAETARLHLMRGWALMGRKWYKDAKASFEKAATLSPDDEDVKYALEEASSSLGQGSNSEIKAPLEAVALPAELTERLAKLRAEEPEFGHGASAAYLLRATCIAFKPDEVMRTTLHRVVRILNDEGAETFSSVRYSYDPMIEQFYVNRVEVRNEKGEIVGRAAVDDAYVLDDKEDITTTGSKAVHIQVPGLKPGYTVEVEVTTQRYSKRNTLPLRRDVFAGEFPTQLEAVYVTGAVKDIKYQIAKADKLQVKADENSLLFQVSPSMLVPYEEFSQPTEKFASSLVMGSSKQTWQELGQDYLKDLSERLEPDPAIDKEAKRLTEGLTDTREKVRVLAAFVQKSVRYKAIEFGVRGIIPNPPGQTLQQRFGDCKDQSLLLFHLLRASGVKANLALMDTEWELPLEPPSMDHFDHMVVYVPDLEKTHIVDATQAYLATADYVPEWLTGKQCLVLDKDNPRFEVVPKPLSGDVDVSVKRSLAAAGPNDVRVVEESTYRGAYASSMRASFARNEPKQRFQHAQELLDANGNYRLEDYELLNFEDPNLPVVLKLTYLAPNAIIHRQDQQRLHIPDPWEARFLRLQYLKDRVTPFRWSKPFTMTTEITFDPSLGIGEEALQGMTAGGKSTYGIWRMGPPSKVAAGSAPSLKFAFSCQAGDFPAKEYADFQAHWTSAYDCWDREMDIHPKAAVTPQLKAEVEPEIKIAAPPKP